MQASYLIMHQYELRLATDDEIKLKEADAMTDNIESILKYELIYLFFIFGDVIVLLPDIPLLLQSWTLIM